MAAQRTRLTFPADTSATAVCEAVQSVDLPLDREEQNLARYALIEVVTNAVRAASEAGADGAVSARILADEDQVRIVVEDGAGGFDVKCLPYDYGADPDGIDVTDAAFDEYREKFDDQRFGLGLLMVRRAIRSFRLTFVNDDGQAVPWKGKGSVRGTRVEFSFRRNNGLMS